MVCCLAATTQPATIADGGGRIHKKPKRHCKFRRPVFRDALTGCVFLFCNKFRFPAVSTREPWVHQQQQPTTAIPSRRRAKSHIHTMDGGPQQHNRWSCTRIAFSIGRWLLSPVPNPDQMALCHFVGSQVVAHIMMDERQAATTTTTTYSDWRRNKKCITHKMHLLCTSHRLRWTRERAIRVSEWGLKCRTGKKWQINGHRMMAKIEMCGWI